MSALCLSNPFISLNLLTIGHICPHSFGFNQSLCTGEAIQKHLGVRNNVAITPILHLHTWVALSNSFYINFSQTFPCWNKQPHEAQPSHPFPASTSQGPERKQGFQWDPCVSLRLSVLKKGILFHFPPDLHSIPCSHLTFSSSLLLMTIFFLPHCFSFFLLTLLLLFHHLVLFSLSAPFPLLQSLIFPPLTPSPSLFPLCLSPHSFPVPFPPWVSKRNTARADAPLLLPLTEHSGAPCLPSLPIHEWRNWETNLSSQKTAPQDESSRSHWIIIIFGILDFAFFFFSFFFNSFTVFHPLSWTSIYSLKKSYREPSCRLNAEATSNSIGSLFVFLSCKSVPEC